MLPSGAAKLVNLDAESSRAKQQDREDIFRGAWLQG